VSEYEFAGNLKRRLGEDNGQKSRRWWESILLSLRPRFANTPGVLRDPVQIRAICSPILSSTWMGPFCAEMAAEFLQ